MYALLTVPEAAYFYLGVAIQALVSGALGVFAAPIILINLLIMLNSAMHTGNVRALWQPLSYLVSSLIIVAMFLPSSFGFGGGVAISASDVSSYAATAGGGTIQTAAASEIVPPELNTGGGLPFMSDLIIRAATDISLAIAKQISGTAHRPFGPVLPMLWLHQTRLTGELVAGARDFATACYTPAIAKLAVSGGAQNLGYQELLPWGGVLSTELNNLKVVPGIGTGQAGIVTDLTTSGGSLITCTVYATRLSAQATAFIQEKKTAKGTPLTTIWQAELGYAPIEVARMLLFREIMEAVGPAVPSPSLTGTYLGVKSAAIAGRLLQGAVGSLNPGTGAIAAGTGEIARVFEGIAGFIRPALFIVWVAPYALGLLNLVLVGFGAIVFLAALIPGAQFRLIMGYFALLALTTATPLWWALIELGAQAGAGFGRYSLLLDPLGSAGAQIRYLVITVIGVPLVFFALLTIVGYAGVRLKRSIF